MLARSVAVLTLATLASAGTTAAGQPESAKQSGMSAGTSQCAAYAISRDPLMVDGRAVHIEPDQLVHGPNGSLLLTGVHNYLFARRGDDWTEIGGDSILGVILTADGRHSIVKSPIPMRQLAEPRAIASGSEWSVVFMALPNYKGDKRPDTTSAFWYARLRDGAWIHQEQVAMPDSFAASTMNPSALIQFGDTLAWALVAHRATRPRNVIVSLRSDSGWTHELVPARYASYPYAAHSNSRGLVLAVVHPDARMRGDGNSLFLWQRPSPSSWRSLGKAVASQTGDVYGPVLLFEGDSALLAWSAESGAAGLPMSQLKVLTGELIQPEANVITLHHSSEWAARVNQAEVQGTRIWAVPAGDSRQIHLVRQNGKAVEIVARLENPFVTPFRIAAVSNTDQMVVIGSAYEQSPIEASWGKVPVTVVWRLRIEC